MTPEPHEVARDGVAASTTSRRRTRVGGRASRAPTVSRRRRRRCRLSRRLSPPPPSNRRVRVRANSGATVAEECVRSGVRFWGKYRVFR